MPPTLCDAVKYHHTPQLAEKNQMEAAIVHVANCITGMAEKGLDVDLEVMVQPVESRAWEILGLDESIIEPTFHKAGSLFADALDVVLPKTYPDF